MNLPHRRLERICAAAVILGWNAFSQQTTAPESASSEMVSHDSPATFRTKVNLVLVPVVVRDSRGRPIGDLKREDFQLFDRGKLQAITKFSVEKAGSKPPAAIEDTSGAALEPADPSAPPPPAIAERYTAYVFDDVHMTFGDLTRARAAADQHLANSFPATDRGAIYTSSGQTSIEFTDDRAQLHSTLFKLRPRSSNSGGTECPEVPYYMADLIENKNDTQALQAITLEEISCKNMDPSQASTQQMAMQYAHQDASRALSVGEAESRYALEIIRKVVRRISALPGQRNIVFISNGFITPFLHTEVTEVVDAAIRAGVTINTLDARGLYVTGAVQDASQATNNLEASRLKLQYARDSAQAEGDVLAELAEGTSGAFFHNNNDLNEGFKRTAEVPEYSYLLGFSPQNLKLDGLYHKLQVKLTTPNHLTVQARRGYYAPKHLTNATEEAKREIEEALFSREVMHDIPSELHTQFFKTTDVDARLAVLARIDVKQLRFRKVDGRNRDDITVVWGLFDRNGNFISANEKLVELRLKDGTLENKLGKGIIIKTNFDVKIGSYVIRLVVRDAEGQLMAAQNGSIEIP